MYKASYKGAKTEECIRKYIAACRIYVSGEVWSMNINNLSTSYAQTHLIIVGKKKNLSSRVWNNSFWYACEIIISVLCVRRKLPLKVQFLGVFLSVYVSLLVLSGLVTSSTSSEGMRLHLTKLSVCLFFPLRS